MHDLLITWLSLVPLDATPPAPVQDPAFAGNSGNGFAAAILGGFFGLGLLVLAMLLITLKPKRAHPRDVPAPRPRPR